MERIYKFIKKVNKLRHEVERRGWVITEHESGSLYPPESYEPGSAPYWELTSVWPPVDFKLYVHIDSECAKMSRSPLGPIESQFGFLPPYERDLNRFVENFQQFREQERRNPTHHYSISGVQLGMTKSMVEKILGPADLETPYYPNDGGVFAHKDDFHYTQCQFAQTIINFSPRYVDHEARVLVIFGQQLDRDGSPYLKVGDGYDKDHEVFQKVCGGEAHAPFELPGWREFSVPVGAARIDASRRIREIRLVG